MIGIDLRGSNANAVPVLNRVTATSSASGAALVRGTSVAIQLGVGAGDLDVEVRVDGAHDASSGGRSPGPQRVIQAPSSWAGPSVTASVPSATCAVDVRRGVEQRVQLETVAQRVG